MKSPPPEYSERASRGVLGRGDLRPQLADFGLQLEEVAIGDSNRFIQLSAERLVLAPYLVENMFSTKVRPPAR